MSLPNVCLMIVGMWTCGVNPFALQLLTADCDASDTEHYPEGFKIKPLEAHSTWVRGKLVILRASVSTDALGLARSDRPGTI
jgi:hypothetical protein